MALAQKHLEAAEAARRHLAALSPEAGLRVAKMLREMKLNLGPRRARVLEDLAGGFDERAHRASAPSPR